MSAAHRLVSIKLVHTLVWAIFAACVVAIPILAWQGRVRGATVLCGVVLVEVAILVANGMRCPLTPLAARYTDDRRPNFDIFLPQWLALYNKEVFGSLYALGLAYVAYLWFR